jgi:hypothetical protein
MKALVTLWLSLNEAIHEQAEDDVLGYCCVILRRYSRLK